MQDRIKILLFFLGVATLWSFHVHVDFEIPKTWDLNAIQEFHLPPPDSSVSVVYAPEEYYNSLPEHVITTSYPVYVREFEKPGYIDSLRTLKPQVVFNATDLRTEEDWIRAGELVFNWPVAYSPVNGEISTIDSAMFRGNNGRFTREGIYPFSRYILDEKGTLVVGSLSCASCHTRMLDDGSLVAGAPGNVFNNVRFVNSIRTEKIPFPILQQGVTDLTYAPWSPAGLKTKPATAEEFADFVAAEGVGVIDRQGSAFLYPLVVPSLIGIKDIRYLDRTGVMRHSGPGDMMRYSAFNQGMDMFTAYNGFIPGGRNGHRELPLPSEWRHPFGYAGKRYTDAQLYALTQYIYSLKPPRNPYTYPEEILEKGKAVFNKSGCVSCHTPPLYTNNKLTPVNGFEPPEDHFRKYDIFNISVETDSVSALYSRRGTGYYKIPSLRGLWMQDVFFHNGNLGSLEEVFDPARLDPDFIPTGFKPPHLKTMAVRGHPFGLDLNKNDKEALIAFLKTL
jgi:hypothetical protein